MDNNITDILFRAGVVLIASRLLIGLAFGEWTLIPFAGIMLLLPKAAEQVILHYRNFVSHHP